MQLDDDFLRQERLEIREFGDMVGLIRRPIGIFKKPDFDAWGQVALPEPRPRDAPVRLVEEAECQRLDV